MNKKLAISQFKGQHLVLNFRVYPCLFVCLSVHDLPKKRYHGKQYLKAKKAKPLLIFYNNYLALIRS